MRIEKDGPGCYWVKWRQLEIHMSRMSREERPYWGAWQTDDGWELHLGTWQLHLSRLDEDGKPRSASGRHPVRAPSSSASRAG